MIRLIPALGLLVPAGAAAAQPGLAIPWSTVDGGGGTSTDGTFSLTGTIGQPDAAPAMTGGGFSLVGGFWAGIGACGADWDGSGQVNSSDISGFLTSWVASVTAGDLTADFDGSGQTNSSDISAFLTAWLAAVNGGC